MPTSPHHSRMRRLSRLLPAFALLLPLTACGVIWPSRGPEAPTPADSLLASTVLQGIVEQYVGHAQAEQFELQVRAGATPDRIPEVSERKAREDARFARTLIRRLDWVTPGALGESDYLTLLAVRSELQGLSGQALYYANDLTPFSAGFRWETSRA